MERIVVVFGGNAFAGGGRPLTMDGQLQYAHQSLESGAETVVDGSPARIDRLLGLSLPVVRVRYRFEQLAGPPLVELVDRFLAGSGV